MVGLGDLPDPPFGSQALGVSADGSVITGSGNYFFFPGETWLNDLGEAFRWTEETGMVSLGDIPGQTIHSNAYDISADGSVVVGYAGFPLGEAFRWTASTGIVGLGGLLFNYDYPIKGGIYSVASAVSADGATVVGHAASFDEGGGQGWEAFRWTTVTGAMVGLGDLPGGNFYSEATSVTGDGKVVVGASSSDIGVEPFVWTESQGMLPLAEVLRVNFGLDLGQWSLRRAYDISQDGLVIVGIGINPEGNPEGWIVCLRDDCFEDDDDDHGSGGHQHHGDKGKGHQDHGDKGKGHRHHDHDDD
jgi:probable HAF family extracellular repeat protein